MQLNCIFSCNSKCSLDALDTSVKKAIKNTARKNAIKMQPKYGQGSRETSIKHIQLQLICFGNTVKIHKIEIQQNTTKIG